MVETLLKTCFETVLEIDWIVDSVTRCNVKLLHVTEKIYNSRFWSKQHLHNRLESKCTQIMVDNMSSRLQVNVQLFEFSHNAQSRQNFSMTSNGKYIGNT